MKYKFIYYPQKHKDIDFTQNYDLMILIHLNLELILFLFLLILSKPFTFSILILRLFIFFCKPVISSSMYSTIIIIYLIKCFNYLYNLDNNDEPVSEHDFYDKHKHKFYIISSGLIAGFITYFVIDKGVNYIGDKFIESELLSEENKKMIVEMQKVPFKFDAFCVSFCVGSSIAYFISKQLSIKLD